ncbi:MAG: TlpA family protein disulfide reductase [Candidatus Dormibacteraceae bacterium]
MSIRLAGYLAAALVGAVLIGTFARVLIHPPPPPLSSVSMVGRPAADFTLRTLDGRAVRLSDLRGRPVVLNFWASWCSGCREEAATLQAGAASGAGGVQFLGIDIQDSVAAARSYESEVKDPYPVGTVVSGDLSPYQVTSPPQTFFIDARGLIVAHFIGPLSRPLLAMYMGRLAR